MEAVSRMGGTVSRGRYPKFLNILVNQMRDWPAAAKLQNVAPLVETMTNSCRLVFKKRVLPPGTIT